MGSDKRNGSECEKGKARASFRLEAGEARKGSNVCSLGPSGNAARGFYTPSASIASRLKGPSGCDWAQGGRVWLLEWLWSNRGRTDALEAN